MSDTQTRPWNRLTLAGKIVLPLLRCSSCCTVALLVGWVIGLIAGAARLGAQIVDDNIDIVRFLVAATAILLFTVPTAFVIIFMEMKVIAFVNLASGPTGSGRGARSRRCSTASRCSPRRTSRPPAPTCPVFTPRAGVVYLAAVLTLLVIPFAPGLVGYDMNIGLLYFFAVGGLAVVGLMMAGWSSFNKYSLLGGLRAAAAGRQLRAAAHPRASRRRHARRHAQPQPASSRTRPAGSSTGTSFQQPLALIVFFIAATAEGNRTPFDLTEADSEIVAGFATEYSGMRFGFFFFAEYVNVFILSALTVVLFFGGWNAPIDLAPILDALGIATPTRAIDPAGLGIWLLWIGCHRRAALDPRADRGHRLDAPQRLVVPEVAGRRLPALQRARRSAPCWAYSSSFETVVGLFWFTGQGVHVRLPVRRGCAARCRGCASTS